MKIKLTISTFLIFISTSLISENLNETQFRDKIDEIYNFKPSKSSTIIINSKAKEMDVFWNLVMSNKNKYTPLLINELQSNNHNPFFYYDGSSLLLQASPTKENKIIAINSISKTELRDVQNLDYFKFTHLISCQGINAYPAIENIINFPDFKAFIVEHALTLGQDYSTLYCFLCMDENLYLDKLIERLKIESNPIITKTLILSIAYTVTNKGQNAIQEFVSKSKDNDTKSFAMKFLDLENKKNLPKRKIDSNRKYFYDFLNNYLSRKYESDKYNFKEYSKDIFYHVTKDDYNKLKELRKIQSKRISDEALEEIEFLTVLLQYSLTSDI